jgi:hypothetical protein
MRMSGCECSGCGVEGTRSGCGGEISVWPSRAGAISGSHGAPGTRGSTGGVTCGSAGGMISGRCPGMKASKVGWDSLLERQAASGGHTGQGFAGER